MNKKRRRKRRRRSRKSTWSVTVVILLLAVGSAGALAIYTFSGSSGKDGRASGEGGEKNEATSVHRSEDEHPNRLNEPDEVASPRQSFDQVKKRARQAQGSVTEVNRISDRLQRLLDRVNDAELERKVKQFQDQFIQRQSKLYVRRRAHIEPDTDLDQAPVQSLVQLYRVVQKPPEVFANTPLIKDTEDPLKTIEQMIRNRTREMNNRMLGRIELNLPDELADILKKFKYKGDSSSGLTGSRDEPDGSPEQGNTPYKKRKTSLSTSEMPVTKQSELATLDGASIRTSGSGFNGEGYVSYGETGSTGEVTWNLQLSDHVNAPFRLQFRYALDRTDPCPMTVLVNGDEVEQGKIQPTGGPRNWRTFSVQSRLREGANTVTLRAGDLDGPHVDSLTIVPHKQTGDGSGESVATDDQAQGSYEGPLKFTTVEVGKLAFAINFGGPSTRKGAVPFSADPFQNGGKKDSVGKKTRSSGEVEPEKYQAVFGHQRVGKDMAFTFPLANGTYDIRLYFIETWYQQEDARVLHVLLQEKPVLTGFDIYATSNEKNKGISKTFTDIPVTDERLRVQLKGRVKAGIADDAIIAGIAIKRSGER